jgi:hypothetical protein
LIIDIELDADGPICDNDSDWHRIWNLLRVTAILRTASLSNPLCNFDSFGGFGTNSRVLCLLAIPKLLKATMIFYIFLAQNRS